MLNKENVRAWIAALRSGEYTQGTAKLTQIFRGQELDCCLGVACKVYMKDPDHYLKREISGHVVEYGDLICSLPEKVSAWLGISYGMEHDLALMNDKNRKSFAEIADYLESQLQFD